MPTSRWQVASVDSSFSGAIDFAVLQKLYGQEQGRRPVETRYSPPPCIGVKRQVVCGDPNPELISTSYVERSNLTIRTFNKRFARLQLAFSKKMENHVASVALHTMAYNFVKVHGTLKTSPAVAAGLATHPWTVEEMVGVLLYKKDAA